MGLAHERCQSQQAAVSAEEAAKLHRQVRDWVMTEAALTREFAFDDFPEAMEFVKDVATVAEEEDHHPEICISYRKVKLELTTHKVGGLTKNDFIMAAKIEELIA
jgi:4a-hydroxytetrahydrobiopterin dehydratase